MPVDHSGKHIMSDIEFPPLVQKRFLNIFLQDECLGGTIVVASSFLDDGFDFIQRETNDDAIASIS